MYLFDLVSKSVIKFPEVRKNEKLAVVFYTGLLKVLNDIYVMEKSYEKEVSNI